MDDLRQAAIDTLLGNSIDVDQLNNDWSHYLDIFDNCCLELIPMKPPNIQLQLATHPDFLYATALYNLARFVVLACSFTFGKHTAELYLQSLIQLHFTLLQANLYVKRYLFLC